MLRRRKAVLPQTLGDDVSAIRKSVTTQPPRHKQISRLPKRVFKWFYSTSLGLFLLLFIGFNTVVPIDSIVQSHDNLAANTLVVLICCIVFIILCLILYSLRVFMMRLNLADIPKYYIPDHVNDLPVSCSRFIEENIERTQEIMSHDALPNEHVKHPGMYHDDGVDTNGLPNHLIFEDVVRSLGYSIQYMTSLLKNIDARPPKNATYIELINFFHEEGLLYINPTYLPDFLISYERLRFGGNDISEEDFLEMMELFIKSMNFNNSNWRRQSSQLDTQVPIQKTTTGGSSILAWNPSISRIPTNATTRHNSFGSRVFQKRDSFKLASRSNQISRASRYEDTASMSAVSVDSHESIAGDSFYDDFYQDRLQHRGDK